MADDLEAFLRQAAQRRAARKKKTETPRQPLAEQPSQPTPSSKEPPVVRRRPAARRSAAGPAQGQPPADHPTMAQTVSRSRSHATEATLLDTSDLEEHAQHLGEEVGHADDKLTARLHARFDHRLGGLGSGEMISDDDTVATTVATVWSLELVRMLRNSQSLRQAVIMSEVLSPPEHRW